MHVHERKDHSPFKPASNGVTKMLQFDGLLFTFDSLKFKYRFDAIRTTTTTKTLGTSYSLYLGHSRPILILCYGYQHTKLSAQINSESLREGLCCLQTNLFT